MMPEESDPLRKPVRGAYRIEQKLKRRKLEADEDAIKRDAKRRDHHRCRWPHETPEEADRCRMLAIQAAHLTHKGMGGDKQLIRTTRELLVTFGARCHDLFDGRVFGAEQRRLQFITIEKADGPLAFEVHRCGRWIEIGRESSVGVLVGSR